MSDIRTVVFDIGNVIVRWDPDWILNAAFGHADPAMRAAVFGKDVWVPLNLGTMSVVEAKAIYVDQRLMTRTEADRFFETVIASMEPLPGSVELLTRVKQAGYRVFALSDNVHEFVADYKANAPWWPLFEGTVISAEIGMMKPGKGIFDHLLDTWSLDARETLFMDDVDANVCGAQAADLHAFQFTTATDAEARMRRDYGMTLPGL